MILKTTIFPKFVVLFCFLFLCFCGTPILHTLRLQCLFSYPFLLIFLNLTFIALFPFIYLIYNPSLFYHSFCSVWFSLTSLYLIFISKFFFLFLFFLCKFHQSLMYFPLQSGHHIHNVWEHLHLSS